MTQSSIWVFPKIVVPPNHPSILIGFSWVFHYKPSILVYPYFWETSIWPHSSIAALLCMRIIQSTMLLRCPKWGSTGSSTGRLLKNRPQGDACPPKNRGIGWWTCALKKQRWWWWDSHVHSCSFFCCKKKQIAVVPSSSSGNLCYHSIKLQGRSNPYCNVSGATYRVLGCLEGGQVQWTLEDFLQGPNEKHVGTLNGGKGSPLPFHLCKFLHTKDSTCNSIVMFLKWRFLSFPNHPKELSFCHYNHHPWSRSPRSVLLHVLSPILGAQRTR